MKNILIISGLIILSFLIGCGGNKNQPTATDSTTQDSISKIASEETENQEVSGNLVLDNGNKWVANAETKAGIQNMQQIIIVFRKNSNSETAILAESLEKEFTSILQKCTMSGEAHTQLHNYLIPLEGKIKLLKSSADREIATDIQKYLDNYKNYFE